MKLKVSFVLFMVFSFVMVSYIPLCSSKTILQSDEYYFEDVNVFIVGRCRTIGSDGTWMGGFFVGTQQYPEVQVTDTRFEGIRIRIYNESMNNPLFSISRLINAKNDMRDAKGIFFWSCWNQFSARLIPPIVFVSCHAKEVLIQCSL